MAKRKAWKHFRNVYSDFTVSVNYQHEGRFSEKDCPLLSVINRSLDPFSHFQISFHFNFPANFTGIGLRGNLLHIED